MRLDIRPSFNRDLGRIRDRDVRQRLTRKIEEIESASNLTQITNLVKMEGYDYHYRMRLGDYRLGVAVEGDMVILQRFGHRRDFYRGFP